MRVVPGQVVRFGTIPATDPAGNHAQQLLIVRADDKNRISWRAGFAWAADGEITTADQWIGYLRKSS